MSKAMGVVAFFMHKITATNKGARDLQVIFSISGNYSGKEVGSLCDK